MWTPWLLSMVGLLLVPLLAQAQVTWTRLDQADPDDAGRRLLFVGLTHDASDVLQFIVEGRRRAFRRDSSGQLTAITCLNPPPANPALRLSPRITGLNAALTVVGTEVTGSGAARRTVGIVNTPAGNVCTVVSPPATVNTYLTAINSLGLRAGYRQRSDPSLGLRRFQGFTQTPDGTFTYLGGICNTDDDGTTVTADVIYPDATSTGWLTFHAQCNLKPDNSYRHEAGFCQDGVGCQLLRDPNGNPLMLPAVTNTGVAYGYTARDAFVAGGSSWVIDLPTQTLTPAPLPPPATPGGTVLSFQPRAAFAHSFLGVATEQLTPCPTPPGGCIATFQWLGQRPAPEPAGGGAR